MESYPTNTMETLNPKTTEGTQRAPQDQVGRLAGNEAKTWSVDIEGFRVCVLRFLGLRVLGLGV